LYTGLKLDYRVRLLASTSASRAASAVAEFYVIVIMLRYKMEVDDRQIECNEE